MTIEERLAAIENRLERLELPNRRLGPNPKQDEELARERERLTKQLVESAKRKEAEAIPVDRSCQVLTSGDPVPEDRSHTETKSNGQQKDYVVLCETERAKGFVRPYRDAYRHLKCGKITTMGRSIAETYARDPYFYSGTMCVHCHAHFPVGEDGEFVWYEMDGTTGPKVGT